ncbi:MAG: type I-E CRISPR-associated protein Cas7/Cse4/CasC [Xanthomonadaceae bacterium]|nr:type I-E CRISPR-associated protein Cas7/Cse4/CasC [Xanthomonadaceae bacterium]MDP2184455.1 type I-E CRISPR-associated protein Cas7/Cse4/CasC [Xanthomonadales bacterium]MDZ4114572.1 type I-E CRISPR-associated protein Cas7/Cse4/CasC [Xanthomonadaceae bacterium]MDZ4377981.1 type I-E CRISPR-associated protein Cas7/Cse4/CasC [Xanthomonadaceae bacterium]
MTAKNFINFHVLISHSPSCLNRDDQNMQKTAIFGGVNRVRVSSQSLKRTMRTSTYYTKALGTSSTRTRNLENLIPIFTEQLQNEFEPALIAKTMELFVRAKSSDEEVKEYDETNEAAESDAAPKKLAVAPWSVEEIRVLCSIVREVTLTEEEVTKAKAAVAKQKGRKKKTEQELLDEALTKKRVKAVKDKIELVRTAIGKSVDIALSGRMATSGLMTSVDGAMAIAHAITTHAVEPQDVDWFTAVDDLTSDAGETGAGHLDTQQFSSGVFYRYASLNLRQLQVNLGLIENMKSAETAESRAQALAIARHVLHLLATVVPSAKQQSFAAHNLADFAVASFADQPISLANAFEEPIKRDRNGGFLKPSITALAEYWARIHAAYGLDETARAFAVQGDVALNGKPVATLAELESWVVSDGQA